MAADRVAQRIEAAVRDHPDRLSLAGCGLRELPQLPPALAGLRALDLAGNRLTGLGTVIPTLTELRVLDLSGNRLAVLPDAIGTLAALTRLDLSENRLTGLPEAFGALVRLEALSLYRNLLTDMPAAIGQLASLERLDLAANALRTPLAFEPLPRLVYLDLSANRLGLVPDGLATLTALRVLDLSGNVIFDGAGLPAATVAVDLRGNPLPAPPPAYAAPRDEAAAAVRDVLAGGARPDVRNFEPVSMLFGAIIAFGGFGAATRLIERVYRRFDDVAGATLMFPNGTRLQLNGMSRTSAIELARAHDDELATGRARLDLGSTRAGPEAERKIALAVDVLTGIPGATLEARAGGVQAQQVVIFTGTVTNPIINGPIAKEEVMGDKIDIHDIANSNINVKSKLEHSSQTINAAPIPDEKKAELDRLLAELSNVLQQAPKEQAEQAEAVSDAMHDTIAKVGAEKPNKISIKNALQMALSTAKDIATALPLVHQIGSVIAGMFGFVI